MQRSSVADYRCPVCGSPLHLTVDEGTNADIVEGALDCTCGRQWRIRDSIPDFTHPADLAPSDAEFRQKYDDTANRYDIGLDWLFNSFYQDEEAVRRDMVALLDLHAGDRVLEVSCGTGKDSKHIIPQIGAGGTLHALELSISMLKIARQKLQGAATPIEYLVGNASYLPFPDGQFDAAFHFGGVNTFGEKRRAIAEMARVVRPGGKVVVGDESVAPWLYRRVYGRILRTANPLYNHRPPLEHLPANAEAVCLRWILGNAFYLIEFRVGEGPPKVDLDLQIPGPRGGTLRSRYYGPPKA